MSVRLRTVCSPGVELLHGVIEADTDGGEAHLPLEPCHQPAVEAPGPLRTHHGGDGTKHAPIPHCRAMTSCRTFPLSLDLCGTKGAWRLNTDTGEGALADVGGESSHKCPQC